jgi:hypothetical protein
LQFLSTGLTDNLDELNDALAVDIENASFDPCNGPLDLYAPIEACTCLITFHSDTKNVDLAHYTVKEYLVSSRICDGPAQKYHMTQESIFFLAAQCFIIYMMHADYTLGCPLLNSAIHHWDSAVRTVHSEAHQKVIDSLVFSLLDPTLPHFHEWSREAREADDILSMPLWSVEVGAESCVTFAHLCWKGLNGMAQRFFKLRMDQGSFGNNLIWRNWEQYFSDARDLYGSAMEKYQPGEQTFRLSHAIETPQDPITIAERTKVFQEIAYYSTSYQSLTLLHLAAIVSNDFLLRLLISMGGDVNSQTPLGFSVLSSALYSKWQDIGSHELQLAVVKLLLSNNANPAVAKTSITPLQLTITGLIHVLENGVMSEARSRICRDILQVLIDAGADINGVADDETNIARIRYGCHLYFLTKTYDVAIQEDIVETLLETRGHHLCYSTPLRILEVLVASKDWAYSEDDLARYNALGDLLKSNGAKSLHIFPVKGLPGYNEEDMEEWGKITENGAKIELKQSNVDPEEDDNDLEVHNSYQNPHTFGF